MCCLLAKYFPQTHLILIVCMYFYFGSKRLRRMCFVFLSRPVIYGLSAVIDPPRTDIHKGTQTHTHTHAKAKQIFLHWLYRSIQTVDRGPFIMSLLQVSVDTNRSTWLALIVLANTAALCWLHPPPVLTGLLASPDWRHRTYKWLLDCWRSKWYNVWKKSQSSM